MTNSSEEKLKVYSEICNIFRHYSNASLTVRVLLIVQGMALLIAWAYVITKSEPKYALFFPICGFIFTWLLYRFHMGYFRTTIFFANQASNIEKELFEKMYRPITAFQEYHKGLFDNFYGKFFTLNAPFTLIGILFILVFIINLVICIG
jgi:hypothetical protein